MHRQQQLLPDCKSHTLKQAGDRKYHATHKKVTAFLAPWRTCLRVPTEESVSRIKHQVFCRELNYSSLCILTLCDQDDLRKGHGTVSCVLVLHINGTFFFYIMTLFLHFCFKERTQCVSQWWSWTEGTFRQRDTNRTSTDLRQRCWDLWHWQQLSTNDMSALRTLIYFSLCGGDETDWKTYEY